MGHRIRYRRRPDRPVVAVQLRLETRGFDYRKWGSVQHCKSGDWLVDNAGDVYTVDAQSFASTYRAVGTGTYVKSAPVWVERADAAGSVATKEGRTHQGVIQAVGGFEGEDLPETRGIKRASDGLSFPWKRSERIMRLIIEARIEDIEAGDVPDGAVVLAVIERQDCSLVDLGMTLAEGRSLLAKTQSALVSRQVGAWMFERRHCNRCGRALCHRDRRSVVLRTVFGKVRIASPRLWSCRCEARPGAPRRSRSPLCKALPMRVTPELQYLQAKWAAYLPYRQVTDLLKEVLPLEKAISYGATRRTVCAVGKALDIEVELEILARPRTAADDPTCQSASLPVCQSASLPVCQSASVACVSVDSAWIGHHSSPKGRGAAHAYALMRSAWSMPLTQQRHVNIAAARATFVDRAPRVYAYVHKQVPSAAARLDQFLTRCGVQPHERVTVISDDAGEFVKAVQGSQLARGRILDWFRIAMKFKAAQNSVLGSKMIESQERDAVKSEIEHAKWLVWHGKGAAKPWPASSRSMTR